MILGDEGVLIVSREQLSHFAALTECLTCFSASIWHISQGEAAQVYVGVCERQILLTTCVRMNMNKCDPVCVCLLTCYTPCGRTEAVRALVFLGGRWEGRRGWKESKVTVG